MNCFKDIDAQIVGLIEERVGLMKKEHVLAGFSEAYITELTAKHIIDPSMIKSLLDDISKTVRKGFTPPEVAFFGTPGSFTHQAAIKHFGTEAKFSAFQEISEVFKKVDNLEIEYGIIPVENSTEGAVNRTLDSLIDSKSLVVGEVSIPIQQNLLSNVPLSEIENVYSHPQALAQSHNWLRKNLPNANLIESENTTEGVRDALNNKNSAAVGSLLAADYQEISVLEKNIQDQQGNTTRFVIISRHKNLPTGHDKTSLLVCTKHMPGALYHSLAPFDKHGISLSMIESRPSKRLSWEYFFFIDFLGHIDEEKSQAMLKDLEKICQFVKVLGSYPRA